MTENEKFTKDTFKYHEDKFHKHLKLANEIQHDSIIYSNFLLELKNRNLIKSISLFLMMIE